MSSISFKKHSILTKYLLIFVPYAVNLYHLRSWNGYNDELVWGAAWLYKATGDSTYLSKAEKYYNEFSLGGQTGIFSWDDKTVGVHALMAEMTGGDVYKNSLKKFCDHANNGQEKSPGGMLYYAEWGSLRYASNAAFICLQVTKMIFESNRCL